MLRRIRLWIAPRGSLRERLLWLGIRAWRLCLRKGPTYLLAAMPEVLKALPTFRLVMIGDGPEQAKLEKQAADLGIAEQVIFGGFQSQDSVRAQMQRARLLVLPSLEERQGVVLLEAFASGTPVVASGVDGIVDVVSEDAGVLVPPKDPSALSRAILHVLGHPERWAGMSSSARERAVKYYDWDYLARKYIAVYESMLRTRRRAELGE